jgi:hypothetical protein
MQKGRFLYEQKLKDHSEIGVYGIFDTRKVSWSYYVISFENVVSGGIRLSPEICGYSSSGSPAAPIIRIRNLTQKKKVSSLYKSIN